MKVAALLYLFKFSAHFFFFTSQFTFEVINLVKPLKLVVTPIDEVGGACV